MLYNAVVSGFGITDQTTNSIILLIAIVLCMVEGYLIGSINPAIIFSKKLYNDDVRKHGSGNAGMTNVLRVFGKKMAAVIFVVDFSKAAIAILLGSLIVNHTWGGAVAALFAVVGHMFPIYYKFKGGKGVSCMLACILLLSPFSFLILIPIFIGIILIFKYVSLASIAIAMLYPLAAYVFKDTWGIGNVGFIPFVSFLIGALVVFMHRENLKRLLEGKENKTYFFKKKEKEGEEKAADEKSAEANSQKVKEEKPEKIYSDKDFVKCSCGRLIPVSRKRCVYCKAVNSAFVPNDKNKK